MEQAHFNAEMLLRPHKVPGINRQAMLDNAIAVWETLPHERSLTWAKKTGVSIALDGSEDTRGKNLSCPIEDAKFAGQILLL